MKLDVARAIHSGEMQIPDDATVAEMMQLRLGACLTDEGEIFCLDCNNWNESCTCID